MTMLGCVVIGRNEGDRLRACLSSIAGRVDRLVYVDSASTDDSVAVARDLGVDIVALDESAPLTAARARNAGFQHLREHLPGMTFVQFVDGDCELHPQWLGTATAVMQRNPDAAVICGRRTEKEPQSSIYNRLCDMEWNTPCGKTAACGGDAMMRVEALAAAGGFSPDLIAGEEPELCHRLRRAGWKIYRLGCAMTRHDAALVRFAQWWQRNRRSGHALAEAMQDRWREDPALLRRAASNLFWCLPASWPLLPLMWLRLAWRGGALWSAFLLLGKLPHAQGMFQCWLNRRWGGPPVGLIEYK